VATATTTAMILIGYLFALE